MMWSRPLRTTLPLGIALCLILAVITTATAVAQPCTIEEHTLGNGNPAVDAGAVQITVDAAGWFGGASFNARPALWRPPGADEAFNVAGVSYVVVEGQPVRGCIEANAEVTNRGARTVASAGRVGMVDFTLVQELSPIGANGTTTFTQRYTLTPRRVDISSITVERVADLGLPPTGMVPSDSERGVASRGGGFLGVARASQATGATGPLVGVTGDLDGDPLPRRWTVTQGWQDAAAEGVPAELANEVAGDGDGDRIADAGADSALRQLWTAGLNANDTVTFTTTTVFTSASPAEAASWPTTGRVAGGDRVGTAIALSRAIYPAFGGQTVVLARADAYPDALAGATLAQRLGGPLLLTSGDRLHPDLVPELRRLRTSAAVLLGGPAALSPQVEADLQAAGVREVSRIAGGDRFATAAAIAARVTAAPDPDAWPAAEPFDGGVYVAEGAHPDPGRGWPDALAVSALAARQLRPVLLTTRDALPAATAAAVAELGVETATVVGGTAAVSEAVVAQLRDAGAGAVRRLAGADRYATAAAVAESGLAAGLDPRGALVASGEAFPDALVAGPAAAHAGALLLLTPPDALLPDSPTARTLTDVADRLNTLQVAGGAAAVSPAVAQALRDTAAAGWRDADHHGAWSALPPAPIGGDSHAEAVWTGTEVVVWGGLGAAAGAAYDPDNGVWREIAEAPFVGDASHQAVWSGERMYVWGSRDGSSEAPGIGAYDPATDSWQELPRPPLPPLRGSTAVWTGAELLVYGNVDQADPGAEAEAAGAAYDPDSGTWRVIADGPFGLRHDHVVVFTDDELVVAGGREGPHRGCAGECPPPPPLTVDAAAYDPASDSWRGLPDAPAPLGGRAIWTGGGRRLGWRLRPGCGRRPGHGQLAAHCPAATRGGDAAASGLDRRRRAGLGPSHPGRRP